MCGPSEGPFPMKRNVAPPPQALKRRLDPLLRNSLGSNPQGKLWKKEKAGVWRSLGTFLRKEESMAYQAVGKDKGSPSPKKEDAGPS